MMSRDIDRTGHRERIETVIVGGGQAGLATAYHLQRRKRPFVVLEAGARVGDNWRKHWDSLRLFTPATLSHLPGMRYPARGWSFPTKDEFADYLEGYAAHFGFDVRTGARAEAVTRHAGRYQVTAGAQCFEADHVVLATGAHREPKVPVFAPALDSGIVQLHSSAYRNPDQLRPGAVLVVGPANSGSEIALELAAGRDVWLAGRKVPVFPVRPHSLAARVVMRAFFLIAAHVLTSKTPLGRRARPYVRANPAPLIRVKPQDLAAAGVRRVGRVVGVQGGRPRLEDGDEIDVANVIWCTGFQVDYSWIDLPACAAGGEPAHERGVLTDEPGMYVVGQLFQHALASTFIGGVGQDAAHIARAVERRVLRRRRATHQEEGRSAAALVGTAGRVTGSRSVRYRLATRSRYKAAAQSPSGAIRCQAKPHQDTPGVMAARDGSDAS
jgi:putative flavoprotein involved in K+ transport